LLNQVETTDPGTATSKHNLKWLDLSLHPCQSMLL
jgi:hypothetical protein